MYLETYVHEKNWEKIIIIRNIIVRSSMWLRKSWYYNWKLHRIPSGKGISKI